MPQKNQIPRRHFLMHAGAGAAAWVSAPAVLRGADLSKDPVRVAHIGTGTRGWSLIKYTGATDSAKVSGLSFLP